MIGGLQPWLVDVVLIAIVRLALELIRSERVGFMAGLAGYLGIFRALRVAAGAPLPPGAIAGRVVMAGGAITGDFDMACMIKIDRIEEFREAIDLDLCRRLVRGGDAADCPEKSAQKHA
jgi:hypothetical protein